MNPLRRILRYVKVVAAEVRVIDLSALAARMASVVVVLTLRGRDVPTIA